MELLNCSLKNKEVECVARMILDNSLKLNTLLQVLEEEPNWLEDNTNGQITESTLLRIVEAGYHNQKFGILLTYIIEYVEGKDVDDLIFEMILCYPDDAIRECLLISLAHKTLKENQLRRLCDEGISFECYFELAILYYTESKYTLEILENFIEEVSKSKYAYIMEEMVTELVDYHVASSKIKYDFILSVVDKYY